MADGSSHPPPKGDNPSPAASTSSSDAETKPDALASVISPRKSLPHHPDKPNMAEAVNVEFDKEKHFAEMMRLTEEVFNMDEETRKKKYPLPSMPPARSVGPEVAFQFLRELYAEMDEENEAEEAERTRSQATPNSAEREESRQAAGFRSHL